MKENVKKAKELIGEIEFFRVNREMRDKVFACIDEAFKGVK